jgi:hypothetical protein
VLLYFLRMFLDAKSAILTEIQLGTITGALLLSSTGGKGEIHDVSRTCGREKRGIKGPRHRSDSGCIGKADLQNGGQGPNTFTADREYCPLRSSRIRGLAQKPSFDGIDDLSFSSAEDSSDSPRRGSIQHIVSEEPPWCSLNQRPLGSAFLYHLMLLSDLHSNNPGGTASLDEAAFIRTCGTQAQNPSLHRI